MDSSTSHPAQIERLQRGTRKPPRTFASLGIDQRRRVITKFIEIGIEARYSRSHVPAWAAVASAAEQRLSDYIAGRVDTKAREAADLSVWWARYNHARQWDEGGEIPVEPEFLERERRELSAREALEAGR